MGPYIQADGDTSDLTMDYVKDTTKMVMEGLGSLQSYTHTLQHIKLSDVKDTLLDMAKITEDLGFWAGLMRNNVAVLAREHP
jgi:hypothetical protein